MKVLHSLKSPRLNLPTPISLTIGKFDGLHLGHQAVIHTLGHEGLKAVLTFSNHPLDILSPSTASPEKILSEEYKMLLLERMGIDIVISIPFDTELSQKSYQDFITQIRTILAFDRLILGYDSAIGANRHGTVDALLQLGATQNFKVISTPKIELTEGSPSSKIIRKMIISGNLEKAAKLLGRPVSFYGCIQQGAQKGRVIGYPTLNFAVQNLCLPPYGVYAVGVKMGNELLQGIANLGIAPTLKNSAHPNLEVHIFNRNIAPSYGKSLEVLLYNFIRPEIHFKDTDQLKWQISKDIISARFSFKYIKKL